MRKNLPLTGHESRENASKTIDRGHALEKTAADLHGLTERFNS
jgi:aerotaxis receptor